MTSATSHGLAVAMVGLTLVASLALAPARAATADQAPPSTAVVIRVDQAGYPGRGPKLAYVMSPIALTGEARLLELQPASTERFFALGSSLGAWNKAYSYVYALHLDAVTAPGTYELDVDGVSSPKFPIGPAATLYAADLANARAFYEDERDGPGFIPSPLRDAPGHINDADASSYATPSVDSNGVFRGDLTSLGHVIDATGGWWDAGDYLKFTETTSYVVAVMLAGVRTMPTAMGSQAAAGGNLSGEALFGLRFLMKMWDQQTRTLYYQVGIGAGNRDGSILSDHDIWRLPQADDTYGGNNAKYRYIRHRPVFRAAPGGSSISPNLAGRLTADFAFCYQVFRGSDARLAATCLTDAETVYSLARTTDVGRLLTAIPYGFYPESTWQDDMELGATELSTALTDGGSSVPGLAHADPMFYLGEAASWAHAYLALGPSRWQGLNLYDTAGLAHYELATAIERAGDPPGLAVSGAQLVSNLSDLITTTLRGSSGDPFAYGASWDQPDSVSLTDGISVMASEYDALSGTQTDAVLAQSALDENLGANPWGLSFLVGDGSASPKCLSHQVANLEGSLNATSPLLAGAAVEGPASSGARGPVPGMRQCSTDRSIFDSHFGVFVDNQQSYVTTEPAIDLTASSLLAFSWLAAPPS